MLSEYEYFVNKTRQAINEIDDLDDNGVLLDDEKNQAIVVEPETCAPVVVPAKERSRYGTLTKLWTILKRF